MAVIAGGAAIAGVLLALAFGGEAPPPPPPPPPRSPVAEVAGLPASAPPEPVASAGAAGGPPGIDAAASQPAPAPPSAAPAAVVPPPSRPASGPGSAAYEAMVESRLTRRLQGAHPLRIDGVDLEILGTQLPSEGRADEPYLVVRNPRTGEVKYWQSGLRFAVRQGVDPEYFIRQNIEMRRLFVNPQYAEVAVDAAQLSAVYARMSADPRVAGVRLLPIPQLPTLR